MCGICGIVFYNRAQQYTNPVEQMKKTMEHRGPDNEGTWGDANAVLGHRRLSIIDLSDAGRQPMVSADGRYVLVYNGEIYNFKELKQQLSDYPYKSNSDSEVILAAYSQWGKECIQYFNGMFAFAIWDTRLEELFVARDRLGIKPLYYVVSDNMFLFASEVRSLLASGLVERKVDKESIIDFFRYQTVHAPDTIIKDIKMLMPGYCLELKRQGNNNHIQIDQRCYWKLGINKGILTPVGKSREQIRRDVYDLLIKSVESRIVSDVKSGVFLSGGIDSSAIVAFMHEASCRHINTFTVTFHEEEYSESAFAKLVAKKFKTYHHEIRIPVSEFLKILPEALDDMDHPSGDGANTWVVSKVTKDEGISMALSGLGSDELFAGYKYYKLMYYLEKFKNIANNTASARMAISKSLNYIKETIPGNKVKELLQLSRWDIPYTYPLMRQVLNDSVIKQLLPDKSISQNRVQLMLEHDENLKNGRLPVLSKISIAEISSYLQNVLLRDTDQMSMAHALEVRVPFLDFNLVDYVLQIPDSVKFPSTPKRILVESLRGMLPDEIINRPKMGFVFPWERWMKNELRSYCEQNLKALQDLNFLDAVTIDHLWKQFLAGNKAISWSRVWVLVVLGNWLKRNNITI